MLGTVLGCTVTGVCTLGGSHQRSRRRVHSPPPCMCKMHILGPLSGFSLQLRRWDSRCSTAAARLHGAALHMINNDGAQPYAATEVRPDRPLTPGALGPPSDPIPDLCASARAGICLTGSANGMLQRQARRVAADQEVCAFSGRTRPQCPAVISPAQRDRHASHRVPCAGRLTCVPVTLARRRSEGASLQDGRAAGSAGKLAAVVGKFFRRCAGRQQDRILIPMERRQSAACAGHSSLPRTVITLQFQVLGRSLTHSSRPLALVAAQISLCLPWVAHTRSAAMEPVANLCRHHRTSTQLYPGDQGLQPCAMRALQPCAAASSSMSSHIYTIQHSLV